MRFCILRQVLGPASSGPASEPGHEGARCEVDGPLQRAPSFAAVHQPQVVAVEGVLLLVWLLLRTTAVTYPSCYVRTYSYYDSSWYSERDCYYVLRGGLRACRPPRHRLPTSPPGPSHRRVEEVHLELAHAVRLRFQGSRRAKVACVCHSRAWTSRGMLPPARTPWDASASFSLLPPTSNPCQFFNGDVCHSRCPHPQALHASCARCWCDDRRNQLGSSWSG